MEICEVGESLKGYGGEREIWMVVLLGLNTGGSGVGAGFGVIHGQVFRDGCAEEVRGLCIYYLFLGIKMRGR